MKSGYPWNLLGQRLQQIGEQFETVTNEYGDIQKAINGLKEDVEGLRKDWPTKIEEIVKRLASEVHLQWSSSWWTTVGVCSGLILTIVTNDAAFNFIKKNGVIIGILIMVISIAFKALAPRKKSKS
jgi:hypothetical protein